MHNCPYYEVTVVDALSGEPVPTTESGRAARHETVTWCSHPKHSPRARPLDGLGHPHLACRGDYPSACLIPGDLFLDA